MLVVPPPVLLLEMLNLVRFIGSPTFPLKKLIVGLMEVILVSSLSRDYHMTNLYRKYFCLLDLVVKLSSISFQLRVNSALPLLDYLKLTVNNTYFFSEAINHYIKTANLIQKIKSRFLEKNCSLKHI